MESSASIIFLLLLLAVSVVAIAFVNIGLIAGWEALGKRYGKRTAVVVYAVLFVFVSGGVAWFVFRTPVHFRLESESPDGRLRLVLQDVTNRFTYLDDGWRLRARLEETRTGRRLADTVIRFWHSGFDDYGQPMPVEKDALIHWAPDGESVLVEYGAAWSILPGEEGNCFEMAPEIRRKYNVPERPDLWF